MESFQNVSMHLQYWSAPGQEWSAWVEFKTTKYGFSVWVGGDDESNGKSRQRIAGVKELYSWRVAALQLLSMSEGHIYGDFRSDDIYVNGEDGYSKAILILCWMQDDNISTEIKEFLINLNDVSLQKIESIFNNLISDEAIDALGRYVDLCKIDPFLCWTSIFQKDEDFSFERLISRLEEKNNEDLLTALKEKETKVQPYQSEISKIYKRWEDENNSLLSSQWAAIARGNQKRKLIGLLENFILLNARVPQNDEIMDIFQDSKIK